MLQFTGSQKLRRDLGTEQKQPQRPKESTFQNGGGESGDHLYVGTDELSQEQNSCVNHRMQRRYNQWSQTISKH